MDTKPDRDSDAARLQAHVEAHNINLPPHPEVLQHRKDIETLRAIMDCENNWCDQGGAVGYLGDGKFNFIATSLELTPNEYMALFRLAGVEPRKIAAKGKCSDCRHSQDGLERGYRQPCFSCRRPVMSAFEARS